MNRWEIFIEHFKPLLHFGLADFAIVLDMMSKVLIFQSSNKIECISSFTKEICFTAIQEMIFESNCELGILLSAEIINIKLKVSMQWSNKAQINCLSELSLHMNFLTHFK